jgi:hypothetical protein
MADLDRDGDYREATEVALTGTLTQLATAAADGWPLQAVTYQARRDYSLGIDAATGTNGAPCGIEDRMLAYAGPHRLSQVVYDGRVWEPGGGWRALQPTSNQHRDHAHFTVAPVVGGLLRAAA